MPKEKKATFEENLARIENIVQTLEETLPGMEKAAKLYFEGYNLIKDCSERVYSIEERMKKLSEDSEGNIILTQVEEE